MSIVKDNNYLIFLKSIIIVIGAGMFKKSLIDLLFPQELLKYDKCCI